MSTQPDPNYGNSGGGGGRQLLLLAAIVLVCVMLYRAISSDGGFFDFLGSSKEVQLKYVEKDFQPNLNEEATLRILSDPARYKKEFDELVYNFNMSLLYHISNRMTLPDSVRRRLEPEYKKHHEYLSKLYYNDFVALKDTSAGLYETWYKDNVNQAVGIFNEVAGKYTCFFVTQIMATLIKTDNGKVYAKGRGVETPCGIALNEALKPMVERLQKRAAIIDFSASRGLLKERVRKGIAELGTYELRSRMGLDKTLQYKVFGFAISETDLRVEAISVVKAGFKLDQSFDLSIQPNRSEVYVTLPRASILAHEVYPRVDKLDVGFLAGITEDEMNSNLNELRRAFRDEAINQEKVLERAEARADSVLQLMLGPMVRGMGRNYKLKVRFNDSPLPADDQEHLRRGNDPRPQNPGALPKSPAVEKPARPLAQ